MHFDQLASVIVNADHGFLRTKNGDITTFDVPDAFNGFFVFGTNPAGTIAGIFVDSIGANHGYVRAANGIITTFDAPGAGTGPGSPGTNPVTINAKGVITGWYADASNVIHGFVRAKNGTITTFDAPGARGQVLARAPSRGPPTPPARPPDNTLIQTMWLTVSCEVRKPSAA